VTGRWTPDELRQLRWHYTRMGLKGTAEYFARKGWNRSGRAITAKASELGIRAGVPSGYVPLAEARPESGVPTSRSARGIRSAARGDGVLFQAPYVSAPACAPEEWVDRYMQEYGRLVDASRLDGYWVRTRVVAERFGVSPGAVAHVAAGRVKRGRIAAALRNARRLRMARHGWVWHPTDVEVAVMEYRGLRRAA